MKLSQFEKQVLLLFLDHDDGHVEILRSQIDAIDAVHRKQTGVGFQTDIDPPPEVSTASQLDAVLGGVTGRHPMDPDPLLFNLFIRSGRLTLLEGLALSNRWPANEDLICLTYSEEGREQDAGRLRG